MFVNHFPTFKGGFKRGGWLYIYMRVCAVKSDYNYVVGFSWTIFWKHHTYSRESCFHFLVGYFPHSTHRHRHQMTFIVGTGQIVCLGTLDLAVPSGVTQELMIIAIRMRGRLYHMTSSMT